jgi:DNA-binding transcriptional regulator YiaG
MSYQYLDCGLDNVWLENGYEFHETAYGQGVSIHDTPGLHKAIGLWLTATPKPLNGAELRFSRLEMELTQRDLASILGATEQTLRLWEKHRKKSVPGPADRLLRALYEEYATGDGSIRRMVDRLATLDQVEGSTATLRDTSEGWRVEPTALQVA